jgi:acyl carrier protein
MECKPKLVEFFKENFMVNLKGDFCDDDSFLENGIIDSTGVLELVMFLEETYNIKVDDEEIVPDNLDSINNIKKYLQRKT